MKRLWSAVASLWRQSAETLAQAWDKELRWRQRRQKRLQGKGDQLATPAFSNSWSPPPSSFSRNFGRFPAGMQILDGFRHSRLIQITGLTVLLLLAGGGLLALNGPRLILVNGVPLAVAASPQAFEQALEQYSAQTSEQLGGQPVEFVEEVSTAWSWQWGGEQTPELVQLLAANLHCASLLTAIAIDGQPKVILESPEAANAVLQQVQEQYLAAFPQAKIQNVGFAENVSLMPIKAAPEAVVDIATARQKLLLGETQATTYVVKEGDCLWTIARSNNMRVKDLLTANPEVEEDRLSLGQELRLVAAVPLVTVVATLETTTEQEIPCETEVKTSNSKGRNYREVVEKGIPGVKEITRQIVCRNGQAVEEKILAENVVKAPKKQVEVRGTQVLVASSRSGGVSNTGSGRLGWPLRGRITSVYGGRGTGYHTGLDIDGVTGQTIVAAEGGKVIEAGWDGGYGRSIVIDHGGGVITRYAHCSSLLVGAGQRVKRGQAIARVGSTGHSTGSHLHFEVIVGGSTKNPTSFLR